MEVRVSEFLNVMLWKTIYYTKVVKLQMCLIKNRMMIAVCREDPELHQFV